MDLTLVPLAGESIRALVRRPDEPLTQPELRGCVWPPEDRRVLRYRREALAADPAAWRWLLHAVVDGDGSLVGRIGCHGPPVDGRVEVGYYVRPHARGRGLATRMLEVYLGWLEDQGVATVALSVGPDNAASLSLVRKFDFVRVGEQWDDEDGLEIVFERTLSRAESNGLR